MNKTLAFLLVSVMLFSCVSQRRLSEVQQKIAATKKMIQAETQQIDSLQQLVKDKGEASPSDRIIQDEIKASLTRLNKRIAATQKLAAQLESKTTSASNFNDKNYKRLLHTVMELDSFNAQNGKRDRMYQMVNEAINISGYKLFDLAAFFGPGVYKVPQEGLEKLQLSFKPAVDSMAAMSAKYHDIMHTLKMVFVGYADASHINEGSQLYNDLSAILKAETPSSEKLNLVLSDLRAREMVRNMKLIINANAPSFEHYKGLRIGYVGFGKGEELPFTSIKDYKEADERRRIVLFYWTILPDA